MPDSPIVLVVHGGAGALPKDQMTPEKEARYRGELEAALRAGLSALEANGASALDGVEAAIRSLEDCSLFNAGKGSAFTREGRNELDASIMEGTARRAGSVACVTRVRNPIAAARAVMEKTEHVLMVGSGADRFAETCGLAPVNPDYFFTDEQWAALEKKLRSQGAPIPRPMGTVGAVARDRQGHLAAGASTGGTTGKRPGRVGDTGAIGAGVYAEDGVCAVSCTGDGEFFLRLAVAHEIVARVKYLGESVNDAARRVILKDLDATGGEGGCIVLAPSGEAALVLNSQGMYRGTITADGLVTTDIY